MNLVKYRPTERDLLDVDRWFDRALGSFFDGEPASWEMPAVDVRESDEHYDLEMDLPGRSEKDFEVNVKDNVLSISSRKDEKKEEKRNGYLLRERRSSSFCRSFQLPADVDREKIHAEFSNGVLHLRIPKTAEAKARKIEVKAN